MERVRIRGLIARASRDLELAKRCMQIKEYVTANLLYSKAMEKVLKALFLYKIKKQPPINASIGYLAKETGVPEEIGVYINSVKDEEELRPADFTDLEYYRDGIVGPGTKTQALYMEGLSKRLLDYVMAYTNIS